jgi:hypothetical protein
MCCANSYRYGFATTTGETAFIHSMIDDMKLNLRYHVKEEVDDPYQLDNASDEQTRMDLS